MLAAQMGIAVGLITMALVGPSNLLLLSLAALLVAFSSATQDVAIDAFRILLYIVTPSPCVGTFSLAY